ncbi:MAG TPA: hypothetical protein VF264_03060 [Rhodanobacteraceae bacterium]
MAQHRFARGLFIAAAIVMTGVAYAAPPVRHAAHASLKSQAASVDAQVTAARAQNATLQAQVTQLEQHNATQQQQIQQRDAEIATLQKKLQAAGGASTPPASSGR